MTDPDAPASSPGADPDAACDPAVPAASRRSRWRPAGRPVGAVLLAVTIVLSGLVMVLGYQYKTRCVGPQYDATGLSGPDLVLRATGHVCYTDLQSIWSTRTVYRHEFPYLHGSFDPVTKQLSGGSVEYPVLTGLVMWATSLPATTDGQFLAWNAAVLILAGLIITFLLCRLTGLRAWWWALAPPLALYTVYNWDQLAVLAEVGAFAAVVASVRTRRPRRWLIWAALLLGIGAGLKFYPLLFIPPIALYAGLGQRPGADADPSATRDGGFAGSWRLATGFVATAVGTFVVVNVPFMIAGFAGWWSSFQFQWKRDIDMSTNSVWYWISRGTDFQQATLSRISTIATAAGLLLTLLIGLWRRRRLGHYPWLPVCAMLLTAYLLFNKVDSPQYSLWLLPFLVLLRVRAGWILAWFVVDAALFVGFFKWEYLTHLGAPNTVFDSIWPQLLIVGVWGRIALLGVLFVIFATARPGVLPLLRPTVPVPVDTDAGAGRPGVEAVSTPQDVADPVSDVVPGSGTGELEPSAHLA